MALLDSLLTYPERSNLSRLLFPIQFGGVCQPGGLLAVWQWGFARHEAPWQRVSPACRASSAAIPPIGGGVAAKLQTH